MSVDFTKRNRPKTQGTPKIQEKPGVKISRIQSITFGAKCAIPVICGGRRCSKPWTGRGERPREQGGPSAGARRGPGRARQSAFRLARLPPSDAGAPPPNDCGPLGSEGRPRPLSGSGAPTSANVFDTQAQTHTVSSRQT